MDRPVDLIAAQRNFIAAVTRPEQHVPAVTRKAAEAMSEMYARAANVPSRLNIEVCSHMGLQTHFTASSAYLSREM